MPEDTRARGAAGGSSAAERDPHFGRILDGRYRIGTRIARGGMASVYEAHDLRLDRTIAVKIMHSGLADTSEGDEAFASRFVREARAAARLSHPNVVAVYDQGEDHGTIFLAMELISGHTLRDTIAKEAPMSPERALAILDPVLSALATAHRSGLIHRDVKPENVLIADDGRIKVADFGLAKAISSETQQTATQGVLIGTVSYLAPELVVDRTSDARADVYAAGVILYELLTGEKPHTGESPIQVAYAHVHNDVPPPSAKVPELPAYVDALVARATTRDRTLRPADAGVMLHHVRRVVGALHAGVREDPELVADLMPVARVEDAHTSTAEILEDSPSPVVEEVAKRPSRDQDDFDAHVGTALIADPPTPEPRPSYPHDGGGTTPARPRRRRRLIALVLAVLLAAGIGGGAYWWGWARYTTAPSVTGLTGPEAEQKLESAGLSVDYADPRYSETVDEGDVISSDPGAGARILPDETVTLTLSLGPERYNVPKLAGLTLEQAEAALADVQFVVGSKKETWSETVPEGQVISSDPAHGTKAGRQLPVDTVVNLVVSKGRRPIPVKDFTGKDADHAAEVLAGRGLTVSVTDEKYHDDIPEGHVISQTPADGTLFKGDEVELVVSLGPPLVEVPNVFYESTDDAVAMLEDLGLEVEIKHAQIYFTGEWAYSTNPPSGEMVQVGSTITLYVV